MYLALVTIAVGRIAISAIKLHAQMRRLEGIQNSKSKIQNRIELEYWHNYKTLQKICLIESLPNPQVESLLHY